MASLEVANVRDADRDGYRVLVDRLWPRGVSKQSAAIDEWAKEVAPSTELRRWFHAADRDFDEFRRRYVDELDHDDAVAQLEDSCRQQERVVLLTATADRQHNHAQALLEWLREHRSGY